MVLIAHIVCFVVLDTQITTRSSYVSGFAAHVDMYGSRRLQTWCGVTSGVPAMFVSQYMHELHARNIEVRLAAGVS